MALILVSENITEDNSIHHITDNIYLGNCNSRKFISSNNIARIIEIGDDEDFKGYPELDPKLSLEILTINISDHRSVNIQDYFRQVWEFIKKDNKNVLIHCKMGTSRSAAFVISYLIKFKGLDFEQSVELIDNARNHKIYTKPNFGFTKILKRLYNSSI